MSDEYTFQGGDKRKAGNGFQKRERTLLPEGDYKFRVLEVKPPHKSAKGNHVLSVKINIEVHDRWIWFSVWSGEDSNHQKRDGIGDFLKGIGRSYAIGEKPDWDDLVGARGRCRIKVETPITGPYAGQERNVVAFVFAPRELAPVQEDDDNPPDDLPW